jgi:hypothetical protein
MVLFVFVRGYEQTSLYSSGDYPSDWSNRERNRKKQIDINYWLERPANSFGVFFKEKKKTRERKQRHS